MDPQHQHRHKFQAKIQDPIYSTQLVDLSSRQSKHHNTQVQNIIGLSRTINFAKLNFLSCHLRVFKIMTNLALILPG